MTAFSIHTLRSGDASEKDCLADELLDLRRMVAGLHLDGRDSFDALETARTRLNALIARANRLLRALEPYIRDDLASGIALEIRAGTAEARRALLEPAREARALSRLERGRRALHRALVLLAQACATRGPYATKAASGSDALLSLRIVLAAAGQAPKSETGWFVTVARAEIGLVLASTQGRLSDSLLVHLVGLDARLDGHLREARECVLAFLRATPSSPEPATAVRR